jgi:hypothetical protein
MAYLCLRITASQSFVLRRFFCNPTLVGTAAVTKTGTTVTSLFASLTTENSTLTATTTTVIPSASTATSILADAPDFIKPDRDLREYRYIRLPNNLRALLVSTAKASSSASSSEEEEDGDDDKSSSSQVEAASVHVQAGHFDDTIPGLAHFHERKYEQCVFVGDTFLPPSILNFLPHLTLYPV